VDYVLQADTDAPQREVVGFDGGACGGRRVSGRHGTLLIPSSLESSARVTIVAGKKAILLLL
jgi:hypothetical protein